MTPYVVVIPARFQSQRLPGKVLKPIGKKTMLEHVWDCASTSSADAVVVATDDQRIAAVVEGFGGTAVMTGEDHTSGSDRIAECARLCGWNDDQVIVNLQGDEPLMPGVCLDQLAGLMADDPDAAVASLYWPLQSEQQLDDPNVVKVVVDQTGRALYFSRSLVPFPRDGLELVTDQAVEHWPWKRHLGVYAYRNGSLQQFTQWQPTPLEQTEQLEQLRFLEHGAAIRMDQAAEFIPPGVDSPEDLQRVRRSMG